MHKDRQKAVELRGAGKSYRKIHAELGVPVSTLSKWFSKEEWSRNLRQKLVREGELNRRIRMRELNEIRGTRLVRLYERAREEAHQEFRYLRYDPLFIAGLVLYYADGERTSKSALRLSSSDAEKALLYFHFLKKACGIPAEKIRASLFIYPGQDDQSNKRFWGFALGPTVRFTKSTLVPGTHSAQKLRYGICTLTVSSSYLKTKMLEWLKILPKELMK